MCRRLPTSGCRIGPSSTPVGHTRTRCIQSRGVHARAFPGAQPPRMCPGGAVTSSPKAAGLRRWQAGGDVQRGDALILDTVQAAVDAGVLVAADGMCRSGEFCCEQSLGRHRLRSPSSCRGCRVLHAILQCWRPLHARGASSDDSSQALDAGAALMTSAPLLHQLAACHVLRHHSGLTGSRHLPTGSGCDGMMAEGHCRKRGRTCTP